MSEFDEALARAVEDGVARGGLPGAAAAVRRGRRRSLRARSGTAVLGVAALGGALGVGATFGSGSGPGEATAAAATGSPASAPTSSAAPTGHGEGLLPAHQWPGYDLVHWNPTPQSVPNSHASHLGSQINHCDAEKNKQDSFATTGLSMWSSEYSTDHHGSADETVVTFADEAKAEAYLADAKGAGSAPACGTGSAAQVPSSGVSTEHGVSWVVTQQDGGTDHLQQVQHVWLAQSGNRIAFLRTMQFGTDFKSTSGDAKVLAEMQQALEK
jgi:hypothetical protein